MKYIMYETGEYSSETGGTKRFRELWDYLSTNEDAEMYCSTKDVRVQNGQIVPMQTDHLDNYRFFRYELTRVAFRNKKLLMSLFNQEYKALFVFDVPAAIGISLLRAKHMCLMCRKDSVEYRKLLLESKHVSQIKAKISLMHLHICEALCLYRAEKIIVQCHYDQDQLLLRHRFLRDEIKKKIYIQINNVNPAWIVSNSNQHIDERLDSGEQVLKVCCVCNFKDKRKGADIMLEAFDALYGNNDKAHLFMIGDGDELSKYQEMYNERINIHFLGNQKNPIIYLKQCDYAVVPSRADSCPNTIMEALYNGVPVIGSNVGGIPDILVNPDYMFEPTVESLKDKLKQIENVAFREDMKRNQMIRKQELSFNWPEKVLEICNQ